MKKITHLRRNCRASSLNFCLTIVNYWWNVVDSSVGFWFSYGKDHPAVTDYVITSFYNGNFFLCFHQNVFGNDQAYKTVFFYC